jgi:hypothetical protein
MSGGGGLSRSDRTPTSVLAFPSVNIARNMKWRQYNYRAYPRGYDIPRSRGPGQGRGFPSQKMHGTARPSGTKVPQNVASGEAMLH